MRKFISSALVYLLFGLSLVACGAKDNIVDGFAPASAKGSTTALGGGTTVLLGDGSNLAATYGQLFLNKLVETANLFSTVTNSEPAICGEVESENVAGSNFTLLKHFAYYTDFGDGECRTITTRGNQRYSTQVDGDSVETYELKFLSDAPATVKRLKLLTNQSEVNLNIGMDRAPTKYMNGQIALRRSYVAKLVSCPTNLSGLCYQVKSRLNLKVRDLRFSPSKNSPVKFQEPTSHFDFRFNFLLNINGATTKLVLNGSNKLFVKGRREEFKGNYGSNYSGVISLNIPEEGISLTLNTEDQSPLCGLVVAQGEELNFKLKWNRTPVRGMERKLNISYKLLADKLTINVTTITGVAQLTQQISATSCRSIREVYTTPFYGYDLIFAY